MERNKGAGRERQTVIESTRRLPHDIMQRFAAEVEIAELEFARRLTDVGIVLRDVEVQMGRRCV